MPRFQLSNAPIGDSNADLLVVTARAGDGVDASPRPSTAATDLADELDLDLGDTLASLDFDGKPGSVARIPTRGRVTASTVLVVGLGDGGDPDAVRRAGAAAAAATSRLASLAFAVPDDVEDTAVTVGAFVEGVVLGSYRFSRFKSDADSHALETVTLHTDGDGLEDAVESARVVAEAVCVVRDLVNTPPGDKRPPALADRIRDWFEGTDVTVRVLDREELERGGYGGLLGVGAGSVEGPRLVQLDYAPDGAERHVALVGKGITFDTGGLSLKPSESMETMKMDMAGAAAVAGTVRAAADLRLPVRITGLLALAENMPSGTAIRPSDVLTIRGGKTVEVMNTDAEGRLVLADALVHAAELGVDLMVDMATLTGGVKIALGDKIGAIMSTDDELADQLLAAAGRTAESFWRLPLAVDEYRKKLDSEVADLKNTGGREASSITAAIFLHEFVAEGIPWAHLDIAGVAWSTEVDGYLKKGGTGIPVRLLIDWLRNLNGS